VTIDRDRVARIEYGQDPYATLAERQRKLWSGDAQGHYELGVWALEHDLPRHAKELFEKAVEIDPGHAEANLALGRVYIDAAWTEVGGAIDLLEGWQDSGIDAAALRVGRQVLTGQITPDQREQLLRITGRCARRLGLYREAQSDYARLAALIPEADPRRLRVQAAADLLAENPSGLYLVQLDRFAELEAESDQGAAIRRSGFYPLAYDAVLALALRDRAKEIIAAGQKIMDQARSAEVTDEGAAMTFYEQADALFAQADAIEGDIARSYRVESARGRVRIYQARAEAHAQRFDGLNQQLKLAIKAKDKRDYIRNLRVELGVLDEIQTQLEAVLNLAAPYKAEFSLVIGWTQDDLATVKAMRKMLQAELQRVGG
jgi:tetratricopeptide (TPR) repeat protein